MKVPKKHIKKLEQTYQTLPEWFLVDVAKEYGNYLSHSPWFNYPYMKIIMMFWRLWANELWIIVEKKGFMAILSEYTLMNLVIGLVITLVFVQLAILAIIPSMIYSDPDYADDKTMTIVLNPSNGLEELIPIPRYKPFTKKIIELSRSDYTILCIAGQTEIQAKLHILKEMYDKSLHDVKDIDGITYLFDYQMLDELPYIEVLITIDIPKMTNIVKSIDNIEQVSIIHIFDY
jgi:hypothetical protein